MPRPDVAIRAVRERLTTLSPGEGAYVLDILSYVAQLEEEVDQRKLDQAMWESRQSRDWEALCEVVELCGGLVPEHALRAPEYVRRMKAKLSEALGLKADA